MSLYRLITTNIFDDAATRIGDDDDDADDVYSWGKNESELMACNGRGRVSHFSILISVKLTRQKRSSELFKKHRHPSAWSLHQFERKKKSFQTLLLIKSFTTTRYFYHKKKLKKLVTSTNFFYNCLFFEFKTTAHFSSLHTGFR